MCKYFLVHQYLYSSFWYWSWGPKVAAMLVVIKEEQKKIGLWHTWHTIWQHSWLCFHDFQMLISGHVYSLSGNTQPWLCQLTKPLWTDPGLKSRISVHELISTFMTKIVCPSYSSIFLMTNFLIHSTISSHSHACGICVFSRIHQTLNQTTRSLTCIRDPLMHLYIQGKPR